MKLAKTNVAANSFINKIKTLLISAFLAKTA